MKAHYGCKDRSGDWFLIVDTDQCRNCTTGDCVTACPARMLERVPDDDDDPVCTLREEFRNRLKQACAPCRPAGSRKPAPCVAACPRGALRQSW